MNAKKFTESYHTWFLDEILQNNDTMNILIDLTWKWKWEIENMIRDITNTNIYNDFRATIRLLSWNRRNDDIWSYLKNNSLHIDEVRNNLSVHLHKIITLVRTNYKDKYKTNTFCADKINSYWKVCPVTKTKAFLSNVFIAKRYWKMFEQNQTSATCPIPYERFEKLYTDAILKYDKNYDPLTLK